MTPIACDEWMGASPIYNARARALLGIAGNGVSAIFKSLQVDPGFAHRYMDVRYWLVDDSLGYFELPHCGAYEDVNKIFRGAEGELRRLCHEVAIKIESPDESLRAEVARAVKFCPTRALRLEG